MSDAESRILPWPGPGGPRPPGPWGPPGPWRPPAGAWPPGPLPPGPGPFPQPPDVFSAFAWLAKNYRESQAAKEFLKLLIQDMIAEDPTFLANAHATVGVTDGSGAQPGMVGEIWSPPPQSVTFPAGAAQLVTLTSMGVLPPGDWNIQGWVGLTVAVEGISLDNIPSMVVGAGEPPPGVSWIGFGIGVGTGAPEVADVSTNLGWARTAVPTLMVLRSIVTSAAAGTLNIGVAARRVR